MVLTGAELRDQLIRTFRWIDPGPASTHLVSDTSGWWREPRILAALGPALAAPFAAVRPTVVVAPESAGLLLGPLVAVALGAGFVPAVKGQPASASGTSGFVGRDGRRIAEPTRWARTVPDYRDRSLALGVRGRHLHPGDRVLVVDDWVASGAQVRALHELIVASDAVPVGTSAVVAECDPELARELELHVLLDAADLDS